MISGAEKLLLYLLTNESSVGYMESASVATAETLIAAVLIAESADAWPNSKCCLEIIIVTSGLILS